MFQSLPRIENQGIPARRAETLKAKAGLTHRLVPSTCRGEVTTKPEAVAKSEAGRAKAGFQHSLIPDLPFPDT
jgi:hypothetical protein